jgi:endonuclease YncB( thermonuclease family)
LKNLIAFWRKDIINKLILLVSFLLLAGVGAFIYVIVNPQGGRSFQGFLSQYFTTPTPSIDVDAVFTNMAQTEIVAKTPAYLRGAATTTPAGTRPPTLTATPAVTALSTSTPVPAVNASATLNALDVSGVKCIPKGTGQVGRVLDILDGVSVKVMLDGLVYNVRYIGLDLPEEYAYADLASLVNGQLVWGRDVTLYADQTDRDELGQLLRYVVIEDKIVNLELILKGLVTVVDLPPKYSCSHVFGEAEQTAQTAKLGQWQK